MRSRSKEMVFPGGEHQNELESVQKGGGANLFQVDRSPQILEFLRP